MSDQPKANFGVVRVAVAGAITAAAFFALCWLGSFISMGPATHMYLNLFTSEPASSTAALILGICWSIAFGLIAGGLFALFYNALSSLDSK